MHSGSQRRGKPLWPIVWPSDEGLPNIQDQRKCSWDLGLWAIYYSVFPQFLCF